MMMFPVVEKESGDHDCGNHTEEEDEDEFADTGSFCEI